MRQDEILPAEPRDSGLRQLVLDRLDSAYLAAMAAFEASKVLSRTEITYGPAGTVEETRSELTNSAGAPRLLQQALKAIEATRQLAGLDAPVRQAHAHLVAIQARMPEMAAAIEETCPRPAIRVLEGGAASIQDEENSGEPGLHRIDGR